MMSMKKFLFIPIMLAVFMNLNASPGNKKDGEDNSQSTKDYNQSSYDDQSFQRFENQSNSDEDQENTNSASSYQLTPNYNGTPDTQDPTNYNNVQPTWQKK